MTILAVLLRFEVDGGASLDDARGSGGVGGAKPTLACILLPARAFAKLSSSEHTNQPSLSTFTLNRHCPPNK
jgi:hypothetical protein